jgi:hypothetical protein
MHDYWIALLGSALSSGIPIPEPLLAYRQHDGQSVGWKKKSLFQACLTSADTADEDAWIKVEQFKKVKDRVLKAADTVSPQAKVIDLLQQKEQHLAVRAAIRTGSGFSRTASLAAEIASGRYQQFSNSWHSMGRDILGSARLHKFLSKARI